MKRLMATLLKVGSLVAMLVAASNASAAESVVYIPLGSTGEVVVVDTGRNAVVGKIPGLPAVHGLAGTPDGQFLIAGSYEEREFDSGMPAKPATISEEEHAAHHGAAPTDAKKAGSVTSTVSVVRTADGSVVRRIDVPGAVHHVAVSPDGRLAVVTHPNEGTISAIDLDTYEVVARVYTGSLPNYAVFSPDSDQVYVSNAGNGTIRAVDTRDWVTRWNAVVGTNPEHVVLSRDGATLYANDVDDGSVSIISTKEGKVTMTLLIGSTLHGIDLSDDGRTLFVAALGDDKLVGVDLTTGTYRSAFLSPEPYHLAAISGTGKLYVSSAEEPKIWIVNQNDLAILGEISIGGKGHQMAVVPQ